MNQIVEIRNQISIFYLEKRLISSDRIEVDFWFVIKRIKWFLKYMQIDD